MSHAVTTVTSNDLSGFDACEVVWISGLVGGDCVLALPSKYSDLIPVVIEGMVGATDLRQSGGLKELRLDMLVSKERGAGSSCDTSMGRPVKSPIKTSYLNAVTLLDYNVAYQISTNKQM